MIHILPIFTTLSRCTIDPLFLPKQVGWKQGKAISAYWRYLGRSIWRKTIALWFGEMARSDRWFEAK